MVHGADDLSNGMGAVPKGWSLQWQLWFEVA